MLTEGKQRAQKFPLDWTQNNLRAQGEPERGEADRWSASLTPGKKQAQQHKAGLWTANPEWQPENLLGAQNTVFCLNYIYISAIHLITMPVKLHSQIWWQSTTLSWWKRVAGTAPSTFALNRSGQGDKLLQKLPGTLKLLPINMTNTATKPLLHSHNFLPLA